MKEKTQQEEGTAPAAAKVVTFVIAKVGENISVNRFSRIEV